MSFKSHHLRKFSLLEVLIALALIAMSLPLLISPFVYMATDMREEALTMRLEKAASLSISSLLIDFHTKKIPLTVLEATEEYEAPFEWYKDEFQEDEIRSTYTFVNLSNNQKGEDKNEDGLWKVKFSLEMLGQENPTQFEYLFVVVREKKP